ncbi:redoxin family protein [Stieleria varia]|uniref:Thiol-disulfide oxidoreductase ResA n=1 Tax=Stieleria varia TaxID=2528005 RepID=A0A5C5ZXR8_9BACT|nr:redoxin family protein [Stieleria varia]TWT91950.1 Thiol-disulfide oxidoreductase ResA [Stieleria varia]
MNLHFRRHGSMRQRCHADASSFALRARFGAHRVLAHPFQILIVAALSVIGFSIVNASSILAADSGFPEEWFFEGMETMRTNLEGNPAIELSTDTWIGDSTTLDDCRGKVVVLDFWATWCGPCVASIPKNIEMVKTHPDDLMFIGMHSATSGWDKAPQMVEDREINYPVVLDTGETGEAYGINAFPTYIIIDRAGIVRAAGVKPTHVKTIVEQLIEESGPARRKLEFAAFDRAWFYAGAERMRAWQDQVGKPARPIKARAWWKPGNQSGSGEVSSEENNDTGAEDNIDAQVAAESESEDGLPNAPEGLRDAELDGVVRVLHFTRPGMAITKMQLKTINEAATKYAPQGVAFVVICDHQSDWDATQAFASEAELNIAMALDAAAQSKIIDETAKPVDETTKPTGVTAEPAVENDDNAASATNPSEVQPREAGRTAQSYHVRVAPVTVVIDRKGRIRATGLKLEQLGEALNLLLAEQAG